MDTILQEQTLEQPGRGGVEGDEILKAEVATQWQLMWWKFRKHKLAMISAVVIFVFYFVAIFAEFFAPTLTKIPDAYYSKSPPQRLHFVRDGELQLYVYGYAKERDPESFKPYWTVNEEEIITIGFFVKGEPYKLWGLIEWDRHFIGPTDPDKPFYLLGGDKSGRDILTRIIYSSRISLSVGVAGVILSTLLGILLGGISGLIGGALDNIIQRLIEITMSVPMLPIMLAIGAAVPIEWSPLRVYFIITILLALQGWTGMARVVRSKFLSLREEDFILAAVLDGTGPGRLIFRHMLPSFYSHIIASLTLALPGMILAETALSFLGVGLRPPVVSWGVMLQDTEKLDTLAYTPWYLWPAVPIIIVVLAFNFLGDGLRDAADPY